MTDIPYTLYWAASGEIIRSGIASTVESLAAMLDKAPGAAVHLGEQIDDTRFMLPGGVVEPLPLLAAPEYSIAADGVAEVTFELPAGALVRVHHLRQMVESDGSPFSFATTVPGVYLFDLRPLFPHRDQAVRITAHAL